MFTSKNVDVLFITEIKIESSFPTNQFLIPGYSKSFRFHRNRNGRGIPLSTRQDIPCKKLTMHKRLDDIEGTFAKINLQKTKSCFLRYVIHLLKQMNISLIMLC